MQGSLKRFNALWLVLLAGALLALGCDVASLVSQATSPSAQSTVAAQAQPTSATSGGSTSGQAQSKDASTRVSDSVNRVLMLDTKVLDSYHLEVSGTSPTWNKGTKAIEAPAFNLKADVAGDNVHFVKTVKSNPEKVTDAYLMNANGKDGGKGYAVQNSAVQEDMFVPLGWVTLPLEYGMPLIFASMGTTAQGEQAVDGRAADKFEVDMAKAPTGTEGILKGMGIGGFTASKGTAWLDKQTGALLKMTIDYTQNVQDAGQTMGTGSGHIDWLVSSVGKVTVKLPDGSSAPVAKVPTVAATLATLPTTGAVPAGTTAPTGAAKTAATLTPTALPTANIVKVGQRAVVQGIALTVTKAEQLDTFGGKKADTGYKWVVATVKVENTTNAKVNVEEENFDYVDKNGVVANGLLNSPSAPGTTGKDVFGFYSLTAGGKVENKTLPIQMKKELLPGLQLVFTFDKSNRIAVNLGF